jgi:predicted dehydrogenase
MNQPVRVAVAGLGNAAVNLHLPALKTLSSVTVVGGCDPNEESRTKAAARFGLATATPTLTALLEQSKPDVVVVSAPPRAHRGLVIEALQAGTHVICEKPLATSVLEAGELVAVAQKAGRLLALNHEFREMPAFRALLDAIRANGGPVFAQAWQNMDLPPWAEPGWRGTLTNGVLYEAGIHLVDFILAAFGEVPETVSAIMSACGEGKEPCDAVALVSLSFSRNRLAQITQNRFCKGETQYFEVRVDSREASHRVSYGGRARVSAGLLRSTTPHVRIELGKSGIAWAERGHGRSRTGTNPGNAPMVATANLLDRTLQAFRDGTTPPAPAQAGYDILRVLAAAYLSAANGRRYDLGRDAEEIGRYSFEA